MIRPAIVAVGYNRSFGMKRLLDSIGAAKYQESDITLIISIDESNESDEVEIVAKNFNWNHGSKIIRRFPERQGLRKHIILCGNYSETYGSVIILEDDLVVSEDFYSYVCGAHETYGNDKRICGISLYSYSHNVFTHYIFCPVPSVNDVFLGDMVVTWGQSWNYRQWKNFKEWYLKNEDKLPIVNPNIPRDISGWTRSWGRYYASFIAENHVSYIYPYRSRTTCFSDFGVHNKTLNPLTFVQVPIMQGMPIEYRFGQYEELVRYDSFFERVLDDRYIISNIPGSKICFDINNMKTNSGGKPYVITNERLSLKKIASYALTLKPASLNAINQIPGKELLLYKLEENKYTIRKWKGSRPKYYADHIRLKYEYHDASWRVLWSYAPLEFIYRLKDKIFELLRYMHEKIS